MDVQGSAASVRDGRAEDGIFRARPQAAVSSTVGLLAIRSGAAMTATIDLSWVFAGQRVGVRQVSEQIGLVTFMEYDLGYFDDETCRLEPVENPFGPKVLPMSPE